MAEKKIGLSKWKLWLVTVDAKTFVERPLPFGDVNAFMGQQLSFTVRGLATLIYIEIQKKVPGAQRPFAKVFFKKNLIHAACRWERLLF